MAIMPENPFSGHFRNFPTFQPLKKGLSGQVGKPENCRLYRKNTLYTTVGSDFNWLQTVGKSESESKGIKNKKMKQVDFTMRGRGLEARAAAMEFIRIATMLPRCHRLIKTQPSSLEKVFGLGLQVAKTPEGRIKVFGFDTVDSSKSKLAVKIIQQHKDEILVLLDVTTIFGVSYPGYCLTCRAYVSDWRAHI